MLDISKEAHARDRVIDMRFTPEQIEFIFADWPNWDEHIAWLMTANRDEIRSWGEAANWGKIEE